MKNVKKVILTLALTMMLPLFSGVKAHASEWSMTFPTMTVAKTDWDHSDSYDGDSWISLSRIVEGPSYYCKAQAVNSNNEAKSTYALCQQGGGATRLDNVMMVSGHDYYVRAYNHYWETSYRWAYGNFDF